jgi:16S rRNA (cytosine967-C5)-methyltransferase
MIAPARLAALRAYQIVERGEVTLPEALAQSLSTLSSLRDKALAAEIATGIFRWRAALDHAIATQITRPIERVDPVVLGILRLGAYQLLFLDRVPARAVVDDAVSLARQRKRTSAAGFVNAVLRKIAAAPRDALLPPPSSPDYLTTTLSHPRWLIERWTTRYGAAAAEAWARFDNGNAPLTLRANTLRTTREALAARLAQADIATEPTPYAPDGLIVRRGHPLRTPLVSAGLFVAQDEASQIVGWLAQLACDRVRTAEIGPLLVLDACASPGGKTLALASPPSSSQDDSNSSYKANHASLRVIAADRRTRRMRLLRDTIATAGATTVRLVQLDLEAGLPFRAAFHLILVDAPCSGLGTLRREPEIRWRRSEPDLARFAERQQRMLDEAAKALRPGGILVYSTCSSEPDENEAVASSFLRTHTQFRVIDPRDWGVPAPLVSLIDADGYLRTLPYRDRLEAFFAVIFGVAA